MGRNRGLPCTDTGRMSRTIVEGPGSLLAFVAAQLGPGARPANVEQKLRAIADANGLPIDAQLVAGQALVVPDDFGRRAQGAAVVREGVARLSETQGARNPQVGLAAKAKLLELAPKFSDPLRTPVGPVALPAIAGVPVRGTLERFEGVKTWLDEAALLTTTAELGRLNEAQFHAVHQALGGRSKVTWAPDRSYDLRDFLPAELQALVDRDLEIPAMKTIEGVVIEDALDPEGPRHVGLTMNCHAAAWEAVRAYQGEDGQVDLYYGEMIRMDDLAHAEGAFQKVTELPAAQVAELLAADLKPGDLIQFFEVSEWSRMTMLVHSAVYVGGGLFFEKPNTEGVEKDNAETYDRQEETPFRLATLANMVKPLDVAFEGKFRVEVLRAQKALEPASVAFESSLEGAFRDFAEKQGKTLGNELVLELEQGSGGGIRAEHASALTTVGVQPGPDGRGRLAEG